MLRLGTFDPPTRLAHRPSDQEATALWQSASIDPVLHLPEEVELASLTFGYRLSQPLDIGAWSSGRCNDRLTTQAICDAGVVAATSRGSLVIEVYNDC